jgi:peroxisomal coenzyme A diphosphatase NUDT7
LELNFVLTQLKQHTPSILGSENFSKFAVLLPLIQKGGEIYVLFEVRSQKLRRQPGEICFPGGRIDSNDRDEKEAAIRETIEELGIAANLVTNVLPLDYLVSPFGMIVYPYVGTITEPEKIIPNPSEVEEVFHVPLSFFTKTKPKIYQVYFKAEPEENFPFDLLVGGENYNWRTRHMQEYFYLYENRVIWGLTARILYHFIEIIQKKSIDISGHFNREGENK